MSGIFVVVPILAAAPVVLSATAAVAAAMGFSMVRQRAEELETRFREQGEAVVEFDLAEARAGWACASEPDRPWKRPSASSRGTLPPRRNCEPCVGRAGLRPWSSTARSIRSFRP